MAARFVNIDHDTPLLLPPDLRDWVGPDHMVHFVMDAVKALDLSGAQVNVRGTGSAQYPPSMMLGLLIYCYANGTFSSRRIQTLTHENVAVRLLCADTHPDHDTICKFRRENKELLGTAFHGVLELAAEAEVLQVGGLTVAVDGTKLLANASKHSAMSHDHVEKQMILAQEQISELLVKAEDADRTPLADGLSIPKEIVRREDRIAKLKEAQKAMAERAHKRFEEERVEHEKKLAERAAQRTPPGRRPRERNPKPQRKARVPKISITSPTPKAGS
jgi:transposase